MTPRPARRHRPNAFTLLEVMIAVAILAASLAALFSSEIGAVKLSVRARQTTTAALLARCKMGEIEEQVLRDGLPAIEAHDTDSCCEGAEDDAFTCEWTIERIELPEMGEEPEDPAAALAPPEAGAGTNGESALGGILSGEDAPSGDMIGEMALSYTYPILKPAIEEQVRRATVVVHWSEGDHPLTLDVTQFLVAEQPPATQDNTGGN